MNIIIVSCIIILPAQAYNSWAHKITLITTFMIIKLSEESLIRIKEKEAEINLISHSEWKPTLILCQPQGALDSQNKIFFTIILIVTIMTENDINRKMWTYFWYDYIKVYFKIRNIAHPEIQVVLYMDSAD